MTKYYEARRIARRCVKCGKQDELTLNGRIHCSVCRERVSELRNSEEAKARDKVRRRELYQKRLYTGLCVLCGKPREREDRVACVRCAENMHERYGKCRENS